MFISHLPEFGHIFCRNFGSPENLGGMLPPPMPPRPYACGEFNRVNCYNEEDKTLNTIIFDHKYSYSNSVEETTHYSPNLLRVRIRYSSQESDGDSDALTALSRELCVLYGGHQQVPQSVTQQPGTMVT